MAYPKDPYPEANKFMQFVFDFDDDWMSESNSSEEKHIKLERWKKAALELCRGLYRVAVTEPDAIHGHRQFAYAAAITLETIQRPHIFSQNSEEGRQLRSELRKLRRLPDSIFLKFEYLAQIIARDSLRAPDPFRNFWNNFWDQLALRTEQDGTKVHITDPKDRAWLLKTFAMNPTWIYWEDLPTLLEDSQLFKRLRRDFKWKDAEADLDNYNANTLRQKLRPFRPKGLTTKEFEELLDILRTPIDERRSVKEQFLQKLEAINHVNVTRNRIRRAIEKTKITGKDLEFIYKGEEGIILLPKTENGSRVAGILTSWCTAYENTDTHFSTYDKKGPFWIFVLPNGEKFQLSLAGNQFHDATDVAITEASQELKALVAHLPKAEFNRARTRCPSSSSSDFMCGLAKARLAVPFAEEWIKDNLWFFAVTAPISPYLTNRHKNESFLSGAKRFFMAGGSLDTDTVEKAIKTHTEQYTPYIVPTLSFTKELGYLNEVFPLSPRGICNILLAITAQWETDFPHNLMSIVENSSLYPAFLEGAREQLIHNPENIPLWLANWTRGELRQPPSTSLTTKPSPSL